MIVLANGKQKWVSDIIGDDFKTWKNEFIILDCDTGCGKSYFCLHKLGKYAKLHNRKILYLCNRRKLRNQIFDDVKRYGFKDTIYVTTYQLLQKNIQDGKGPIDYDYIVADECHYFMTDATFNDYTDVAYNYIMQQKKAVVLFVSATAKKFFKYLLDANKVKKRNYYRLDKDYSYVDKVYYYQSNELISIIDDILENEKDSKIVVFCNVGSRIIEMSKVYKNQAHYYCSKSTKDVKLREICGWNSDKVDDCIKYYSSELITFDKRILFTTSVLDNGIDLKDERIKHIFTEIIDIDTMIQSLGRKRHLEGKKDTCTFYIREYQKKGIQGFINQIKWQLDPVKLYKEDYQKFYDEYGNGKKRWRLQKNKIFYSFFRLNRTTGQVKINECKYRKYSQDYNAFSLMKEIGHIKFLELMLAKELVNKSEFIVSNVKEMDLFLEFMKSLEGKRLYWNDRNYIKKEFENIGVKLRYTGINTFNGALEDNYKELYKCRFYNKDIKGNMLIDKRRKLDNGLSNPNRDKTYWVLEDRCMYVSS